MDVKRDRSGTVSRARPSPIVPKTQLFDDFEMLEVARQICLFEQSIYTKIHPKECLDQCWSKSDRYTRAPTVMRLIDFFNHFSNWVATMILKHEKLDGPTPLCSPSSPLTLPDRVRELKRFMRLASELRLLNNFNGCQEVLAGLADSSIFRLRASWLRVEKDQKLFDEFTELKTILSPDKNWATYRNMLKEVQPPCIPYLGGSPLCSLLPNQPPHSFPGTYLTDLTFIEDGNPNYLQTTNGRTDILNFEKCRKQAVVIGNILLYQQDHYNFDRVDAIFDYFARGLVFTEDKDALHKRSRTIEPPEMVEEAKRKAAKKAEKEQKERPPPSPSPSPSTSTSARPPATSSTNSYNSFNSIGRR